MRTAWIAIAAVTKTRQSVSGNQDGSRNARAGRSTRMGMKGPSITIGMMTSQKNIAGNSDAS